MICAAAPAPTPRLSPRRCPAASRSGAPLHGRPAAASSDRDRRDPTRASHVACGMWRTWRHHETYTKSWILNLTKSDRCVLCRPAPGYLGFISIIISRRTDTRCRRSPDTGYGPIRTTRPILILLSRGNDLSNDVCRVHLHHGSICMLPRGRAPGRGWLAGGGSTPARRRAGAAAGGRSRTARRVVRRRVPRCRPPRPRLTGLDRVRESVTDVTTLPMSMSDHTERLSPVDTTTEPH